MAVTDNIHLSLKICQMYYVEKMSQKEIASELEISRSQISRILAAAWENNIVSVKINNPFENEMRLERELKSRYHLKDALVLKVDESLNMTRMEKFGLLAARNLDSYIDDGDKVGVTSGRTVGSLVRGILNFHRQNLEIIPLIGSLGSVSSEFHANFIARDLAEYSGGKSYMLNVPAKVQDLRSKELLLQEPEVAAVLSMGAMCDVVLLGIGEIGLQSTIATMGGITPEEIDTLNKLGAVASVCTSFLDINGKIVRTEISERLIGQSIQSVSQSKKIAIAVGRNKIDAIKAAFLGNTVDIFMTDFETARALLN
ncbi:MAG: sugar-binding transcriptional regulator [Flexilinea sp.]